MSKMFDLKPVKTPVKTPGKEGWLKRNGGKFAKASLFGSVAGAGCVLATTLLALWLTMTLGLLVSAAYGVYQGIALGMDWRTPEITDLDIAMIVIFGVSVLYRVATAGGDKGGKSK